jgi:ABC-2 type transport system permease protein
MRLLQSEFLRAASRRLVPMVLIGGLIGIVIGLGIAAAHADKPSAAEVAQGQITYENNVAKCEQRVSPQQIPPGYDGDAQAFCEKTWGPGFDGFFLRDLDTILQGTATFLILLGVLLGASLGGADWTNNTMQTLLTWEPRRMRVFLVRAFVIAVCVFVITVFLQVVFAGVDALVASTRGITAFLPSAFWRSVFVTIGRVSLMATGLALIAYAVAMIGRSTVASLGALFGYLILFEAVIAGFRPTIQGNLLVRAAIVVITHQPIIDPERTFDSNNPVILLGVSRAWLVVGVYLVAVGALGLMIFRRRDVT